MEPRPLLELNVQQAIASILQKPRWWIKWQDQHIREKWISEVEQQFLLKTIEHSLVNWSHGREPIYAHRQLLAEPAGVEKYDKLRKWLNDIATEFRKGDDEEEDEDEEDDEECDEDDERDASSTTKKRKRDDEIGVANEDSHKSERKRLRILEKEVDSQESYPALKWTFNQLLLHERLSAISIEEWTDETTAPAIDAARSVEDPVLASRAAEFVPAIRRGVSVEEALPMPPGSDILSEDRMLKLKMHSEKIHRELDEIQSYIAKHLELVAKREKLTANTDPGKVVICPAGVDGVWLSDNIISNEVATRFSHEVAALENVPDDKQDWHPRSKKQVLDLVHPSLFCCVFGKTLRTSKPLDPSSYGTPTEQMNRVMFAGSVVVEKPNGCNTDYQWIPSDLSSQKVENLELTVTFQFVFCRTSTTCTRSNTKIYTILLGKSSSSLCRSLSACFRTRKTAYLDQHFAPICNVMIHLENFHRVLRYRS